MFLTSPIIKAHHGFFTRNGGVSQGEFASLNCGYGSGEDKELVSKNRNIVREKLGAVKLLTVHQVHSNIAVYADDWEKNPEADAIITNKPGIAIGVLTADCAPILFCDEKACVIGAAHAGWKGARFGIIESTIKLMKDLGAKDISASVGPCIHQKSYEVSDNFIDSFLAESVSNKKFFKPSQKAGHLMFNLPAYIEEKLRQNGINKVDVLNEDTLTQPDNFYSYRRGTLAGKSEYGRQISAIVL